jgi:predicted nucleotidyltransferase
LGEQRTGGDAVEHVLRQLDKAHTEWPLSLVTKVNVFGSFARGAPEPHDVHVVRLSHTTWTWTLI